MQVKVLHTADNHLRASQYARPDRGPDFAQALHQVVDLAIAHGVQAVINSGDILDTTRPVAQTAKAMNEINHRLIRAGIPMYTISGNHDKTIPHWSTVLASDGEEAGIICVDGRHFEVGGLKINALPYSHNQAFLEAEKEMPKADILMWHGMIQEFVGYPTEKALSLADLPVGRYQAILLGDVHVHDSQTLKDGTLVAYPGATELCSAGEQTDKWCDLYTFGSKLEVQELPIKTRPVLTFRVSDEDSVAEVLTRIKECAVDNPLIFVSHAQDVEQVFSRLCQVVDPTKAILRTRAFKKVSGPAAPSDQRVDLKPQDFLSEFIPPTDPVFELGELLLGEACDAQTTVDQYVERELGEVIL